MSYFPAFLQLENKKILLVGGGNIAVEKLQKLLDFTSDITIIAIELNTTMQTLIAQYNLQYFQKHYDKGEAKSFDIVIAAVDDLQLQEELYYETRQYRCLYNAVDKPTYCDFIFPSYTKKGDLIVAISTSGSSPAFAKAFRRYLEAHIPKSVEQFLEEMKRYRKTLPKGKERMRFLEEKTKEFMQKHFS